MRLRQLDILRAVAILLVLGRHFSFSETLSRGGWSGVDLFFVLSGFLISGLLFAEFKKGGRIDLGRFLIRRGFKIYPPFYAFMGWTVAMFLIRGGHLRMKALISELFFLQSYVPAMWPHTWSLAVEEHFYLALPLLLIVLSRFLRDRRDPFRALPGLFVLVACASLGLRLYLCRGGPLPLTTIQYKSHLNVDGLLFGVVLSYFYHFQREQFDRAADLPGWFLLAASASLIAPCFVLTIEQSSFLQTLGHPMLYLGYGGLLMLALRRPVVGARVILLRPLGDGLAYLGKHSYSVYLWHSAVAVWGLEFLRRIGLLPAANPLQFVIYAILSFAIGIEMARLVEIPALKIRDRLFPTSNAPLTVQGPSGDSATPVPSMVPEAG